jgi:hypothetical protein
MPRSSRMFFVISIILIGLSVSALFYESIVLQNFEIVVTEEENVEAEENISNSEIVEEDSTVLEEVPQAEEAEKED